MLVQSKSLIDAAKRNGVQHIVHLGAFTTDHDSYATVFAWHQMIETYFATAALHGRIYIPICLCRIY
jgi:NAD(P)H dehydrogenase (quinone)